MHKRAKSYASRTRSELTYRHKQTDEVKQVLTGAGFKEIKPSYTSKPNIEKAEIQHQVLCHDFDKPDYQILFGKKQNLRHLDPEMSTILAWGEFDPPVKNDFTSTKSAFQEKYKINKMGVEFISEKQDNYRDPVVKVQMEKSQQIIEYVKNENQSLIKQKILSNLQDKKEMEVFTTEYREQAVKNDEQNQQTARDLHNHYDQCTAAGVARYLKRPKVGKSITMPQEFKNA